MGFLNSIFGSSESSGSKEVKELPWLALTDKQQLETIEAQSKTKTQVIFKHSTTCGISRMAMKQFVSGYDMDANLDLYYLDLLSYRDVSNAIAEKFQVMHESPQMLVIKNGTTVAHASHSAINDLVLEKFE
ncbi:bacillithiol system redox-active protein YtxJ [Subsaximicrobium wynnwilliamsii]|jgi:bacillithiol system protein YtxJ|uniref:Bacillithiol system redox-active protein YtxJ n=1 Tax=Subsaximicrobium wynnwilliamsii TaxID=291179 RepID=A0A5C6ZPA9_9FLAO|nr:bacillithiol system redox-active protein YtxJ [Subsaximicrobium wynnwilliamsii]TXD85128.1 bacillithiol system redox-active protein YtxJ [Subsaximicrobium wynnwilliamsii]TXD91171.1 bacillithiol system redox-active protein YtxJ [Subsaximicrobium wynnwilliamsii]TXE04565.1 bacillithiol system redox-active protein YtxJ [Subsaximicrobium wynnwilliamsii]